MKTSTKIVLCIAAVCVIAGAAMGFAALRMTGGDMQGFAATDYKQETYYPKEPFAALSIEGGSSDVTVERAADGVCRAVCNVCEGMHYNVQVREDALHVVFEDERTAIQKIGFQNDEQKVKLYLPSALLDAVSVRTSSGEIALTGINVQNAMTLRTSSGDVLLSESSAKPLSVRTSSGEVCLTRVNASAAEFQSSSGDVLLSESGAETLSVKTSSGEVGLSAVTAKTKMQMQTSSGDVSLLGCDAPSISIETSSGDVAGRLSTPKIYDVQTSSGNVATPPSAGDETCAVRTSSGDVKFS